MDITYHYPPELFNLLVDTIPLLCRSKKDVIIFFKGAGISEGLLIDLDHRVKTDRDRISKFEITRTIITRLNEKGEAALRERREIIKRVTEFESFAMCWEEDRLKAKGLVAEIQQVVNVKDSFSRMNQEREQERQEHLAVQNARLAAIEKRKKELALIRSDLSALFNELDTQKRGKKLESVLNRLFKASEILVQEAFTLCGSDGEGIVEQIDGVIELDGSFYLVEMKWWNKVLGMSEVSQHLVRIYNRGHARGIFISTSDYSEPAISICRDSLTKTTVVLCLLEEIVHLLEREGDLKDVLRSKIRAAIIDKNPFLRI